MFKSFEQLGEKIQKPILFMHCQNLKLLGWCNNASGSTSFNTCPMYILVTETEKVTQPEAINEHELLGIINNGLEEQMLNSPNSSKRSISNSDLSDNTINLLADQVLGEKDLSGPATGDGGSNDDTTDANFQEIIKDCMDIFLDITK